MTKPCRSPYCECEPGKCRQPGYHDDRASAAEGLLKAANYSNKGYELGNQADYEKQVKQRNQQCFECPKPADFVRSTQFAGNHYYCVYHAHLEPDFDEMTAIPVQAIETALQETTRKVKEKVANDFVREIEQVNQELTNISKRNQYLLDKLQEEAAEVIQAVSKIRRFGPHNHHPDRTQTNLQELVGELEDFQAIVWALEEIQYLDPKPSTTRTIKKYQTLMSPTD